MQKCTIRYFCFNFIACASVSYLLSHVFFILLLSDFARFIPLWQTGLCSWKEKRWTTALLDLVSFIECVDIHNHMEQHRQHHPSPQITNTHSHTHTHTHTHTVVSEILNSAVDAITQPARACWSGREGRWWEQRKKGLLFHFQWLHRKFFPLWSHCLQPCRMKWDVLTCCDQDVFLLVSDFFNHTFQNWFIPQTRRTYSLIPLLGCRCLWLMDFFLTFWSALLWVQCDLWLQGQRSAHTHLWVLSARWNKNLNKGCTFT